VESNKTNNLAIACWTTSRARLRLLEALQAVVKCEKSDEQSAVALYCDTDSIIYGVKEGYPDPLAYLENPYLGGLKDEKKGLQIMEFCSCGPKNYALKLKDPKTNKIIHELKIKGITLDYNTAHLLHYDTFKEKCLRFPEQDPIFVNYQSVLRPDLRTGNVYSVPLKKMFRPVVRKGIVNDEDYRIIDFGETT
jgi:hypothetical protein